MLDYAHLDSELIKLAILFSMSLSLLIHDRYGVSTGGTIMPGILAMSLLRPFDIAITLVVALMTFIVVHRYLRPRWMLWGRRLLETEIVTALMLHNLWTGVVTLLASAVPTFSLLHIVGFTLPGVTAHDMGQQGVKITLRMLALCTALIFGVITLLGAARSFMGMSAPLPTTPQPYAFPVTWLVVAINVSVFVRIFFHRNDKREDVLRTGGFVMAAYLALFVNQPLDLVFVLACSLVTFALVTYVVQPHSLVFGRSKHIAMYIVGIVVVIGAELALRAAGWEHTLWSGYNFLVPTVVTLLANDAEQQGAGKMLLEAGISTLAVFTVVSALFVGYNALA